MVFEAKALDLTLELKNTEGEVKKFLPKERITSSFATKVLDEMNIYIDAQKSLPEKEQDKVYLANLKFLSWMYKDIDTEWVKKNFNFAEINEMKIWAFNGLAGIKKDEES